MTPISHTRDLELMQLAYIIGKHIKSCSKSGPTECGTKPFADFSSFVDGPDPSYEQTKKGLVLEVRRNVPCRLHTPWGRWTLIKDNYRGDWSKITQALQVSLRLTPIDSPDEDSGDCFSITKWRKEDIETAAYRKPKLPVDTVIALWEKFKNDVCS